MENNNKYKNIFLFLFFLINIIKDSLIDCSNCEKVGSLPADMQNLLPNYSKLNRFHLLNHFFLGPNEPNTLSIEIKDKSVFKLQIIPFLGDLIIEITLPNNEKIELNGYQDIPLDYINFQLQPGVLKFVFNYQLNGETEKHNKLCNLPHFSSEIFTEKYENFMKRNSKLRKDTNNLHDFQTNFQDIFELTKRPQNLPLYIQFESYKLRMKELKEYKSYNVSVIADFDLNIDDREILLNPKENSTNSNDDQVTSKKYLIDFNIYSDFFYGGSFFLAIIRKDDLEKGEIKNYECLFNEKCILSERLNKNNILLRSILTPGEYKIILLNFLDGKKYEELLNLIQEIPITAKLQIKNFIKEENRYNCPGRHLPSHLNFLKDKYNNDYLEYVGDVIMNTEKLFDETTFYVEEDSLLRIIAFAHSGENIGLELYNIPKTGADFEKILHSKNTPFLADIISKIYKKKNNEEAHLKQISEHFGENDGMLIPLLKGNTYKIVFNYKSSIISETEKKNCEMFYLKMALSKISHIKNYYPNAFSNTCVGANDQTRKAEMGKLLKDFSDFNGNNSKFDFYDSLNQGFNTILKAFFDRNQANSVIYSGRFSVENPINLYIEILSDFVTSFITPIIIPDEKNSENLENLNIEQILNHKHQKITFHENHLKLNLEPGKYRLYLINGISQFYNEEDIVPNSKLLNYFDLDKIPKCLEFQIRISAQKLVNQRMLNWECNSREFQFLPSSLNTLGHLGTDKINNKYTYFSKHLLIPQNPQVMKIKTGKEGMLMRLIHEYAEMENEGNSNEKIKPSLEVTLNKNKKILKTSKPLVLDHEFKSNTEYITHLLKPNTEYELIFKLNNINKHYDYYSNCKLFKLEITLLNEKTINNENEKIEKTCVENKPKLEEIAYERIIGLTNSFFKYGSKSILQMFISRTIFHNTNTLQNSNENQELLDLETSHPSSTNIQFLYDPKTRPFNYSVSFDVRSALARVTIYLENPYSSILGISAKLFSISDEIEELIAIEDMDEQGFFSIKGIQLELGKYKVEFYSNNLVDYKKDISIFKNNFKKICVNFSASILIENRPFDFLSKHVSENFLSCPYEEIPTDLNFPGWLSKDTGYSINLSGKYKISSTVTKVRFIIHETSLFKFHIPDEDNNIFNYIDLYKISGNSKKRIKEKLESKDNYINMILEKGSYQLDFVFRGVDDSNLNEDKKCHHFDMQLIINPSSNVEGGITPNNNLYCNQIPLSNFNINSFQQYLKLVFTNEKNSDEKTKQIINIPKSRKKGSFMAEIILNPYIDSNFRFVLYEKIKDEEKKEFPIELIYNENMLWLVFHYNAHADYYLELIAESFDNYSICSNLIISYNHQDNQRDSEIDDKKNENKKNTEIKSEDFKKNNCKIHDHLPSYLFAEKNSKNTILEKYGGPQEANGLVDINGEFLLPPDSAESRTTFYITISSIIYIRIIPKYSKEANVYMEIYKDKNLIYRYSHNDYVGVLMYHLDPSKSPYILNLAFDKTLEQIPCGSYQLLLSIIPRDIYKDEYINCDENYNQKLPEILFIDKAQTNQISTHLKPEKDDLNIFTKDSEGNFEKNIKLELKHSYAVTLILEYVESDNFLDITLDELIDNETSTEILELGVASHSLSSENTGIMTKKAISVNLKKGIYNIKIVFHKLFRNLLIRNFKKEINDLCLGFIFQYEFSELNLKHDIEKNKSKADGSDTNEDEINSEIDLSHIDKSEQINPDKILILGVEPPQRKSIRLNKKFEIELKFSQEINLDKEYKDYDFLDFIYLEDPSLKTRIFPINAEDVESNLFKFIFSSKTMQVNKCYDLRINKNNAYYQKFEDDKLEHKYCTTNCDCNPQASFKCGKSGECVCHYPYMGHKCEKCAENFSSIDGKCVEVLVNCDETKNCSGHGKCANDNNSNFKTCICDTGFSSYSNEKNLFCNTCSNPKKNYPFCLDRNEQDGDSILSENSIPCEENPKLYKKLFSDFEDEEKDENKQDLDGSLNLSQIFQVSNEEETTEITIPEDSVIRIFYHSFEINNSKIFIFKNKYDEDPIAFSDGKAKTESFIARLKRKKTPYVIKILHLNLKTSCNKYKLKISIKPINQIISHLKCKKNLNLSDLSNLLPSQSIILEASTNPSDATKIILSEKKYYIPENLIIDYKKLESLDENHKNSEKNFEYNFSNSGILSGSNLNEPFVYNIRLEVKNSFTISISLKHDFLTSDINLALRDNKGKIIKHGRWAVQEDINLEDKKIRNKLQMIVDPGVFYLTIKQNLPANHLVQILNNIKKKSNLCFGFELFIQYNLINKPDKDINTAKYESMFNRLIEVEPSITSNIRVDKKFKVIITFEDPISSKLKDNSKNLKDVFYFENSRNKNRLNPSHIFLQGGLQKAYLILFEENTIPKDECFELIYNLDLLISEDKDKRIVPDKPLVHKYCSHSCDCNPHTNFKCMDNGECQCEDPYTGKGCFECIEDFVMVNYKCISQENCNSNFCSGHGECEKKNNINNLENSNIKNNFIFPTCKCENPFSGSADCSVCSDPKMKFPDCEILLINPELTKDSNNPNHENEMHREKSDKNEFNKLNKEDAKEIDIIEENSEIENKCSYPFIPFNLDSLGYLHLDGKFHISRKYSFKHFEGSHYSTSFTIKTRSHIKIYLEHSKKSHEILIFLLKDQDLLETGNLFVGPAGLNSASFLDLFIDPIQENGVYKSYKINFYIKNIPLDDEVDADKNIEEKDGLKDECFNAYLEMVIIPSNEEVMEIQKTESLCPKEENLPNLIAEGNKLFDYHTVFYGHMRKELTKYTYIRDSKKYNLNNDVYFFHDYFYVPDHLDQELILEIEILSKFINSHVGVLLEIVEIPTNIKIDHKKITSQNLKNIFKEVKTPICQVHCFTGVKKENSVILSRILPSDTYFRIWFYDMNPTPSFSSLNEFNKCVNFEMIFDITQVKADDTLLLNKKEVSICANDPIPKNLNIKGYLGDSKYIEKWGFHILDSFRIDKVIFKGLVHETFFELKEFHLMRLVVFHGRIDTDIELFYKQGTDYILLARSNSKNFEDVIAIELAPGEYKLLFKFFPPSNGFHKCESVRMEFSMNNFRLIQENINRMVARHKNNPIFSQIDLNDMVKNEKDIFSRDFAMHRHIVKINNAFSIDKDDISKFEPSVVLAEMSFTIEPLNSNKIELYAIVQSDFLYLDASWYLTEVSSKKIISSLHKKNMNILATGALEAGTYVLTLRYYRRLHSINNNNQIKNYELLKSTFAELDVNLSLINRDTDSVKILTNTGYLDLAAAGQKHISHNWLCRNKGFPIPKSLQNLRYLEFNTDIHILDNFLVPTTGEGTEVIKFRLKYTEKMMLRVYVECHFIDIDIQIRELVKNNEYKILSESKQDIYFETLMELIKDDTEYEIVLFFKGSNNINQDENILNNSCQTFKMEIALEVNHNYACPESSNYSTLTQLRFIPEKLPMPGDKIFKYDSRKLFLGEDKNSGYVYMIRKDTDQEIKFADLNIESDIDFKLEIIHDFMQAPTNIFLVKEKSDESLETEINPQSELKKLSANVLKTSNIDNASIIDFGEIFENRSSLIIKNLPPGKYSVYLYLPALKTTFMNEARVCSIYDVVFESKKSRGHFKDKEIAATSIIKDDNLDIPTRLPLTLNSLNLLESSKYIINHDYYYLRKNSTNIKNEIINTIKFEIEEESLVEFIVSHDIHAEKLLIKIENESEYNLTIAKILKKGKYEISIKLSEIDLKTFDYNSINQIILFFVGINPVNRVNEVYSYNNMISTYHQCQSTPLPSFLKYNTQSKSYFYHIDDFKMNKNNLINKDQKTFIGRITIALNSKKNRFLIELGSDLLYNDLSINLISVDGKKWESQIYKNIAYLDVIVPKGKYFIEIELKTPIQVKTWECIIFSLDIHVIDIQNIKDMKTHFKNNIFDSSTNDQNRKMFIQTKCNGEILPIKISEDSENDNTKIDSQGEYNIHLNSAIYFDSRQITKNNDNLNEIEVNLKQDSLIRITIYNLRPKNFVVIPKLKQKSIHDNEANPNIEIVKENVIVRENIELTSHHKKERNLAWFLEKNTIKSNSENNNYIIQLEQEKGDQFNENNSNNSCPIYGLDISINSLTNLSKKFECPSENGKVLKYKLPVEKIFKDKFKENSYHELIEFSYVTENQYSDVYTKNKSSDGFEYKVDIDIEEDSHISMEIGYDNSISLFDAYIMAYDEKDITQSSVVATSDVYFNKFSGQLLYKRIINTNLSKGKYSIIILENVWNEISRDIRSFSGVDNHLCLPFEYKLDILSLNQKNSKPEIYNIFPSGSYLFKSKDEDINMRISFSKTVFTHQHKQITNEENFMNIVEGFYFKIVPGNLEKKNNVNLKNSENGEMIKIYPEKVSGSTDGKIWDLFFLSEKFEDEKSYKLEYDDAWIFDVNYSKFVVTVILPTVRIETKKEDIFAMVDDLGKIKENINDKSKLIQEDNNPLPPKPPAHLGNNKCGDHGKLIYDNILKKYHCSCLHGYTGKYCKICEGKINPETKHCEIDEEDYQDEKINDNDDSNPSRGSYEPITETYIDNPTYSVKTTTTGNVRTSSQSSPCGNCVHGICDANLGRCICEIGYIGRYCDALKNGNIKKDNSKPIYSDESSLYTILDRIVKLILGIFLLFVFWVLYKCTRVRNNTEYETIPNTEFEMQSDYKNSKLELDNPESSLVDYEIKSDHKKRKHNKIDSSINNPEL